MFYAKFEIFKAKTKKMKQQFEILRKSRLLQLQVIEGLTIVQLNTIPKGFKNNIAYNIAHLVVTQQLLCYRFSGEECLVSNELIDHFKKGTFPSYDFSIAAFEHIKKLFLELPERLMLDYSNGIFKNYTEYTTSVGVTLRSVEDAIAFNNFHEGIHLGVILQLKKLV